MDETGSTNTMIACTPTARRSQTPSRVGMLTRWRRGVVPFIIAAAIFTGCSREESVSTSRPATELIIALQDEGQTLDPHEALDAASMRLIENMYSTLLRYAPEYGEVEPDLAQSHTVSEDGLVYTFQLRPDARFHGSGRAVTSGDVKYSIERIIEKSVRADHFAPVDAIDTPDETTVVFRLREPFAPFLLHLANPMNAIVDREVVEANDGSLRNAEAGSGPFRLAERMRGQRTVLEKNESYYVPNRPILQRIVFRPLSDETARTTALRRGEIDLVLDLAAKDVQIVEGVGGVKIQSTEPGTFWEYIGLNTARPPLDNVKVRQAIAWAVDRQQVNAIVKLGRALPITGGHIRPGYWAHADLDIYPKRDVERAKALLAEAGQGEGLKLVLKVGSAFPYQVDAAQVVKQQLRDVGIAVELQALESSVFFDALGKGDFDMTVVGWVGFVDPDDWTYNLFHTDGRFNQQNYSNPKLDELLERGRRTMGRDERKAIYAEAQRIIAEEAPMVFLYLNDQTSAFVDDLEGFVVHPTASTLSLRDAKLNR